MLLTERLRAGQTGWARWCDRRLFGACWDVGFEGLRAWEHVTIPFVTALGSYGGIGAWYDDPAIGSRNFRVLNCTFTNNVVRDFAFTSSMAGYIVRRTAMSARASWPVAHSQGTRFSG
jgi:hypothetical protein